MNGIIQLSYNGNKLRVVRGADGLLWLVTIDVCDVLDLEVRSAISSLNIDEKSYMSGKHIGIGHNPMDDISVINEQGLKSLINKSQNNETENFKNWICYEGIFCDVMNSYLNQAEAEQIS